MDGVFLCDILRVNADVIFYPF